MFILHDIPIGQTLRTLRKARKWTQSYVSIQVQLHGSIMSRSTYANIECGAGNIKASDLVLLKKVFETSYEVLFGEEAL